MFSPNRLFFLFASIKFISKFHYSHFYNKNKSDALHIVDHGKLLEFQTRKPNEAKLFLLKNNMVFVNILNQIIMKSWHFLDRNLELF